MAENKFVNVYAESSPNPNSLKFVLNFHLLENGNVDYPDVESTQSCPLAKALFEEYDFVDVDKDISKFVGRIFKEHHQKDKDGNTIPHEDEIKEGKKGLYDNIHAKRKRGESPAKPGDKGYPAKDAFKKAAESVEHVTEKKLDPVGKEDGDIDNDGDKDKSDKYLLARRKKVGKIIAMSKKK